MTEPVIGDGLTDIKVESNAAPAPVEQQSPEPKAAPELATTEPKTPLEAPVEVVETAKPKPLAEDKTNAEARQAIADRLRADDAERRLKELQPKAEVPDKQPDINDQASWGKKYKDAPNDLETFLKAHSEWAREEGKKEERAFISQQEQMKQQAAIRTAVAQRDQEARAKHTDYDAVIDSVRPVIANVPLLKDFVSKNAMGAEVAYELGKNPAVLRNLMQADAWTAGEQLLNIAARLKAPKPVEITNAPEPMKPVGSRETVKPRISELAEKDINGYIATMNKRELAKRRAN